MTLTTKQVPHVDGGIVRRIARRVGKFLGGTVLAALAALALALLSLNLPAGRDLVMRELTKQLTPLFRGQIRLTRLQGIHIGGAHGVDAVVLDDVGRQVIDVRGLAVKVDTLTMLSSLVFGDGDIVLSLSRLSIEHVDLLLDADESGEPHFVRAFAGREEPTPSSSTEPGRGFHLSMRDIHVAHVWAHGKLADAPRLDVELFDCSAALDMDGNGVRVAVPEVRVVERSLVPRVTLEGKTALRLSVPAEEREPLELDASYAGVVGAMPVVALLKLNGEELDARLGVQHASSESLRELVPGVGFGAPLSGGVRAQGTFEKLEVTGALRLGSARAKINGKLTLAEAVNLSADISIVDLDLRDVEPGLPSSKIAADAGISLILGEPTSGTFRVVVAPSRIAAFDLKELRLKGAFVDSRLVAEGAASLREVGSEFALRTWPEASGVVLDVELSALAPDLTQFRALEPTLRGNLRLRTSGTLRFGTEQLEATVYGDVNELALAGGSALSIRSCVRVAGSFAAPVFDAKVEVDDLRYGDVTMNQANASLVGPLSNALIALRLESSGRWPDVSATSTLRLGRSLSLNETRLLLWRQGVVLGVSVERLSFPAQTLVVKNAVLAGAGQPLALDLSASATRIKLSARGPALDLQRVFYVLGQRGETKGLLDVDVQLKLSPASAQGKLEASLTDFRFSQFGSGNLRASAAIDESHVSALISGQSGAGHLELRTDDLMLAGSPLRLQSWRRALGQVVYDVDLDLKRLKSALPNAATPFEILAGTLKAHGVFEQTVAGGPARLTLRAETQRLALSPRGPEQPDFDGKVVHAPPPWRVSGVDVDLDVNMSGAKGETQLNGRLRDKRGAIILASLDVELPYSRWLKAGFQPEELFKLPFTVELTIPRRQLTSVPALLRPSGVEGEVELALRAEQGPGLAKLELNGGAYGLQFQGRAGRTPLQVKLSADYANDEGKIELEVRSSKKRALASQTQIVGKLTDLLPHGSASPRIQVSSQIALSSFPLGVVPWLAERQITGRVSGAVKIDAGTDHAPEFDGALELERLRIAGVRYASSALTAKLQRGVLDSGFELKQVDGGLARLTARVVPGPGPDTKHRPKFGKAHIQLQSKAFRASALQPFARETLAELDGRIDADVRLELAHEAPANIAGFIALKEGRFQLESVGEQFRHAQARIAFERGGVITLEQASAEGGDGRITATASARLQGSQLADAKASVRIPKRAPFPIVLEGEPIAEAWGKVELRLNNTVANQTSIDVELKQAGARLAEGERHELQELGAADGIRIGVQRNPGEFTLVAAAGEQEAPAEQTPNRVVVTVNFRNVELRRGTTLRAVLDGQLKVENTGETRITGQIRLISGILEVEGKRFEIERGTVTFVGQADNPDVLVTAGWTAPDGTRVYAEFVGPLRTGKVSLRAEPAHSQSEILSLILFGTTDGLAVPVQSSQQSSTSTGVAAVGVGGGIATQGINRALDDLTGLDITTRIDTTDSSNPRPEVQLQIARDVSLSIAHLLGTTTAAMNQDRNFLILDWRFSRNWSLETTFGDRGSTIVDAVWQRRY